MLLSLSQHPDGVTTEPGNRVVYDVERDEAYESVPDPVYAAASEPQETAFVGVLVLTAESIGRRTITYEQPL